MSDIKSLHDEFLRLLDIDTRLYHDAKAASKTGDLARIKRAWQAYDAASVKTKLAWDAFYRAYRRPREAGMVLPRERVNQG